MQFARQFITQLKCAGCAEWNGKRLLVDDVGPRASSSSSSSAVNYTTSPGRHTLHFIILRSPAPPVKYTQDRVYVNRCRKREDALFFSPGDAVGTTATSDKSPNVMYKAKGKSEETRKVSCHKQIARQHSLSTV